MEPDHVQQIEAVLDFWFTEVPPEKRFERDPTLDATIRARFAPVYEQAVAGKLAPWRQTADGRLAEIILLDQFSRNLFRDDPRAFAQDEQALALAREAVRAGADQEVSVERRAFFYLPFMHSESPAAHEEALVLFEALGNEENLKYEHMHKDIIDQFGRYPHRNAVLGRESTPAERTFLETHEGF